VTPQRSASQRMLGKAYSVLRGWPPRDQATAWAECRAMLLHRCLRSSVLHLLRSEEHQLFLSSGGSLRNVVGTVHLPAGRWHAGYEAVLSRLGRIIVYFRALIPDLTRIVPEERIAFVHDGVDTDFFVPAAMPATHQPRLLFAGVYLRNTR